MPDHVDDTEVVRKPIIRELSGVLAPGESVASQNSGIAAFLQRTAPAGKFLSYVLRFEARVHDADPRPAGR